MTPLQTPDGGWWEGKYNSKQGWFPCSLVELKQQQASSTNVPIAQPKVNQTTSTSASANPAHKPNPTAALPTSIPDVKSAGIVKTSTKSEFKTLDELMMAEAGVKIDDSVQTALAKVRKKS